MGTTTEATQFRLNHASLQSSNEMSQDNIVMFHSSSTLYSITFLPTLHWYQHATTNECSAFCMDIQ